MPNSFPDSPSSVTKPTQIDPQVDQKSSQNRSREGSGATGWPQVRPKSARKPPKSAPEAPRELPGSAPRLPKGASEGQEGRPRGPKGAPRRPRWSPSRLQVASESEKVDFLKIIVFPKEHLCFSRVGRPKMRPRSSQIASRSLSRATLGEKSRSRRPVERPVERLGAPRLLEGPVGRPVGQPGRPTGFAHPLRPVGQFV